MLEIAGYVILGVFLLMVPGFLFSLVLYPKLESLDFWSRMGVSLALGVLLLIYVGYFLAKPEVAMLQLWPFVGLTLGVCAVLAVIAYFRGGFEVLLTYTRPLFRVIKKFKPRSRKPSTQPMPESPLEEKLEGEIEKSVQGEGPQVSQPEGESPEKETPETETHGPSVPPEEGGEKS
ncbi:MAG TPA: hypothetical protein ENF64_00930 [Hadesarchaea archaeon]|nr:hypothetical protein [Hadesarchaea archaeon]